MPYENHFQNAFRKLIQRVEEREARAAMGLPPDPDDEFERNSRERPYDWFRFKGI